METTLPSLFDSTFLAKLEQLHLLSRKIFRGQQHAERRTRQTGSSLEFADYRNYTAGDDLRSVDWNVYGRLNRLFVKLFEAEQDLHVSILLDCSASMHWLPEGKAAAGALSKFDHARRIAAALGYVALANLDRVNLFPFSQELAPDLGFVRGKGQFHSVLNFLKRLSETPPKGAETAMLASFRTFSKRMKRRGLVFVISDLFSAEAADAVAFLRQQQFEVAALQILDEAEVDPTLLADLKGDLELSDTETGATYDVQGDSSLLTAYREQFNAFTTDLEQNCRRRGIGYLQTTTAIPFEDLVLQVLRERHLVK